jgi:xylose dehydrogenase (NAD/NADP)
MIPGFAAAKDSAVLRAVASRSQERAELTASRHGIARAYGAYEALLADPEIEAVYLPLPNDQHTEWTLRCLDAGKHVLCDKPGALAYDDALRTARAADAAGLRLMEGFMYRHHPQHERIAEIVRSGEIGVIAHFAGDFTYPAAFDPTNIRWNAAQGGGALLDTGVYPLNAARFHFGDEPIAVSAVARRDAASGVDLHTVALLEWADGRTATIQGGFDQSFATRYALHGDRGAIRAERAFQVGEKGVTLEIQVGDDIRAETIPHVDQYGAEITHFSACVRDSALPLWPGEDGARQARVVEAVIRAARERRRVEIGEITG